nr:ImmA/IrrE family metallo-endopeptidase [uncultured Desulfobacter sp.]
MDINRQKINTIATKIRLALEMNQAPYDPKEAILKLNGRVVYDIHDHNTDAYIEKIDNEKFCIHLNHNRHPKRERFTLAHELGHLFLHMGFIIDQDKWDSIFQLEENVFYRDNTYSKDEYEANEFGAAFIMPKQEFLDVAENNLNNNQYSIEPIGEYFDVSNDAVLNRGKWLGIFKW